MASDSSWHNARHSLPSSFINTIQSHEAAVFVSIPHIFGYAYSQIEMIKDVEHKRLLAASKTLDVLNKVWVAVHMDKITSGVI